ncbi:MAG: hypothetical protein E2582_16070 [Delftia sp.]|jgi:hypothetical protein|nr:hypothetical protein [Delftia sp.]
MQAPMPATPQQALIAAIHQVRPPVLTGGLVVDTETQHHLETVTVTYRLTPELVKAWGDECAKLGLKAP